MPPLPLARSEAQTPSRSIGPRPAPAPAATARETAAKDADRIAACLLEALAGLDLTSADGRAGIRTLLSEIDRLSPGAILQQAAAIELRRAGWRAGSARGEAPYAGR
ncbi:MAG TPA: hypothetical protein VFF48_03660 [Brevundimonas sp.]|nr:hypothetical protein [Brevundimonas sp.]